MSSLFDIARSGIRTYQTALSIAAENIANVDTDGYARQEVRLTDVAGAPATYDSAGGAGGGSAVADVVRAFSDLIAGQTRTASAAQSAALQRADLAGAIESLFVPSQSGIDDAMAAFYHATSALTGSPASLPLRQVVMQTGRALAGQIADASQGLATLRGTIGQSARIAAGEVSQMLDQLDKLNRSFPTVGSNTIDTNALASARDQLLGQISQRIGIQSTLDNRGRATVTLAGAGTMLVSAAGASPVAANLTDRLELSVAGTTVSILRGGSLGGLSDAAGMLDAVSAELDAFAGRMAAAANAMQTGGTDLSGADGQPMFRLVGVSVSPGLSNSGTARLSVVQTGGEALSGPVTITRGDDALWHATDASGAKIASGASTIALSGLQVDLTGNGKPGDRFTLIRRDGHAADMAFVLSDPVQIAAAQRTSLQALAGNAGDAPASLVAAATTAGLTPLGALLADGPTVAAAVPLLGPGIVGMVPVQGGNLQLASLGSQSKAAFAADDATFASASTLHLTTRDGAFSFDLTRLADGSARPADWGAGQIAAALNDGRLLGSDGRTLAAQGGHAAGGNGQMQIALAAKDIIAARLDLPSGSVPGAVTASAPVGGAAQVFTRSGVHLAGTPLAPSEALQLLSPANGFLPDAVYDPSRLNAGYRGMEVSTTLVPGAEVMRVPLGGLAASSKPIPAAAAQAISVAMPLAGSVDLTAPAGATAAQAAAILNGALPGLGASATTALELRADDGAISFDLGGDNTTPVAVSANVTGGDLSALAAAISAKSGATGLRAELSPDGRRLLLLSDRGATIDIGNFRHSAGGAMVVTEARADGSLLSGAASLGAGGLTTVRVVGSVGLSSATGFSATTLGQTVLSAPDAATQGLFRKTTSAAGAQVRLEVVFDPSLDGSSDAAGEPAAAGTTYSVSLGGTAVSVAAATIGARSAQDVAAALATGLRAGTPDASLTGTPITALPPDGTRLELVADGQSYWLSMVNGLPTVTGPEAGRITATLTDNRLTLAKTGSADGSAIRLKSPGSAMAAAFGLGSGAMQRVRGQVIPPGSLPAGAVQVPVSINGVSHFLTVSAAGSGVVVTPPPGFPGSATVDADGAISLWVPQSAGTVAVGSLPEAGFLTLGASVGAAGGSLMIGAASGVPDLAFTAESTVAERLSLSGLPPEELLIGMTGAGALNLAGGVTPGTVAAPRLVLQVVDATQREVAILDAGTGDRIAAGFLGADGQGSIGGYAISLGRGAVTGDRYALLPAEAGSADGSNLQSLIGGWSGAGSLTERFNILVSDIGSQTAAARTARDAATSRLTAAEMAEANLSTVDLNTEAARLLQLQQAYQANAKTLSVARDLFDTLLKTVGS